jgi:hypothetical protein
MAGYISSTHPINNKTNRVYRVLHCKARYLVGGIDGVKWIQTVFVLAEFRPFIEPYINLVFRMWKYILVWELVYYGQNKALLCGSIEYVCVYK